MRFLPVFLDLRRGHVALVGGGPEAVSKLRLLLAAGASVRWFGGNSAVAPVADASPDRLEICGSDPLLADFSQFLAVVSAAGEEIDERVAARARRSNVPVNVVDRPELSTFIVPAVIDRGDVVVAIGTGGASPVLARRLRERIEALLPARIGDLAALMNRFRQTASELRRGAGSLRQFWERVIDGPIGAAALAGRWHDAEAALARAVSQPDESLPRSGMVSLVGAGPGDADLLTLRALHALQNADLIFYDELVTPEILDRARRDAERVFVGKRSGQPGIGQDAINQRLADAARRGQNVVRLKGGDPFIFGRGGEELEALRQAGIATDVIPGITAALGCAAEAGLPLSFRNEATRVMFLTAHHADTAAPTNWSGCADAGTTLVIYMGLGKAAAVRDGLIGAGRDADTPVAVLVRGTRPDAKQLVGRLRDLAALATRAGAGPALLVVGQVVTHAAAWQSFKQHLAFTGIAA